jgi:hypothetical protein
MLLFAALSLFVIRGLAQQTEPETQSAAPPNMMAQHEKVMVMGPGMRVMGHDPSTMAEMGVIHELVVNHHRIKRTVTNLPDGIRTVTESNDPQIAKMIKDHVASMDQRVSAKSDPGLPMESPALKTIQWRLHVGDADSCTDPTGSSGDETAQSGYQISVRSNFPWWPSPHNHLQS